MEEDHVELPVLGLCLCLQLFDHDTEMVDHVLACLLHVDADHQHSLRLGVHKALEQLVDGGEGGERGEFLEGERANVRDDQVVQHGDTLSAGLLVQRTGVLRGELVEKL